MTEQTFGGAIPEGNLAFERYNKRRVRRSLKQILYIPPANIFVSFLQYDRALSAQKIAKPPHTLFR